MKPQARIQASIEILDNIRNNTRVPMDTVVGDYMRHRRYIGSKDRANVAERVYDIMRSHARLGWWLDHTGAEDTARSHVIAWCVLGEKAGDKRMKDLFDGSKYAPEELSEADFKLINALSGKELDNPKMPPEVISECPPLYADKLKAYFGNDFETEMKAMLQAATLDLRVNTFLAPVEKVEKFLEADGVKTSRTPYSPWGLRCANKTYLSRTKAMGKGWIEIQDEGSQLIAAVCNAQPGMQVLDYCAGAGGKTLALGAAMQRKGRIVAMDNDDRRLKKGRERYKKAQLADIIEVRPLSEDKNKKWLRRQKDKFDIVLLDVPCTGTGTWRRNPDMRWTTYGPSLEELTVTQAEIMDKVVHAVKPGGHLVYATCSLLPDENEAQVEAFLKRHDNFEVTPIGVIPSEVEGSPSLSREIPPCASLGRDDGQPFMRLTPHRHNTDGFFAAVLKRKEG